MGAPLTVAADETNSVEIHGYGSQSYLRSSANSYLKADVDGTWDSNNLALLFAARVDSRSTIWAQLFTSSTAKSARLDWAFVDYEVTPALIARAGQIKFPIGLYNEIRDIDFLQLSTLKPALYHEAAGIANEVYRGVALAYNSRRWHADVYFGQSFNYETPDPPVHDYQALFGGRVTLLPVDGVRFMVSAYNSHMHQLILDLTDSKRVWVASADVVRGGWDLKAEYARAEVFSEETISYYSQIG